MIDESTIKAALYAIAVAGSALPTHKVIWHGDEGPQPEYPYLQLRLSVGASVGVDRTEVDDNPTPSPGAEIIHSQIGNRRLQLELTHFTGPTSVSPITLLERLLGSLRLPSQQSRFWGAKISNLKPDPISANGGVAKANFSPRATLVLNLLVPSVLTETGTYIEIVQVTRIV